MTERRTISVNDVKISVVTMMVCIFALCGIAISFGGTKEKVDNIATEMTKNSVRTESQISELNKRLRELEKSAADDRVDHEEFRINQKIILEEIKRLREP